MKLSELKSIIMECIEEMQLDEKAPKRKANTQRPNIGDRPNTIYGGNDPLKRREHISKAMRHLDQKSKNKKTKGMIGDRKSKNHAWVIDDKSGNEKSFEPKSSYKNSGIGRK